MVPKADLLLVAQWRVSQYVPQVDAQRREMFDDVFVVRHDFEGPRVCVAGHNVLQHMLLQLTLPLMTFPLVLLNGLGTRTSIRSGLARVQVLPHVAKEEVADDVRGDGCACTRGVAAPGALAFLFDRALGNERSEVRA